MAPATVVYWCPACGARYQTAGECADGHAPTVTMPLSEEAAVEQGEAPAPIRPGVGPEWPA